jgi:DNA-binding transcriptional regulator YdaS (Cro superfamily)
MKLATYLKEQRGRTSRLANRLGVSISLVSMWANRVRPVPPVYAFKIERWTHGVVRVEVMCPGISFKRGA